MRDNRLTGQGHFFADYLRTVNHVEDDSECRCSDCVLSGSDQVDLDE